jgi:hypothetical protein
LRNSIAGIKTNAGCTADVAADLGIVGGADSFDPNTYIGEIRAVELTAPEHVTIKFGKARGNIDGVNVYSRKQGTTDWKFLARDTQSPYVDTTPLATPGTPEVREYRVRGVINDDEIGDYSPALQITVS